MEAKRVIIVESVSLVQQGPGHPEVRLCRIDSGAILSLRQNRLCPDEFSLRPLQLSFVLAFIEGEEHLSRFDYGAFDVVLRQNKCFYTGSDKNRVGGVSARRQLGKYGH